LLLAGIAAFVAVVAAWVVYWALTQPHGAMFPVDLTVYRDGGLIVRGVRPYYDPAAASPLYDWGGYTDLALKFTYTPFAAISFALLSFIPLSPLIALSVVVNMAALVLALWFTIGGLGYVDGRLRAGLRGGADVRLRVALTLLCAAATLWAQPVLRTIYLGQINLVLMALIIWDLCQPRERPDGKIRWWQGFGTGVAAGIKLVPLVFVPYLLATRRFREAAMTLAGFAATIAVGFAVLPADSSAWWLHGVFLKGGRAGFLGWAGNQSLRAIITRFAGSVNAGTVPWAIAAVIAAILGIAAAALLSRAGHEMPALLMTALTGLLISPISWDHHWVWIAPGFTTAVVYARRWWGRERRRAWWLIGVAAGILVVFGAWPDALWESARNLGSFSLGFLWAPPNTNPVLYTEHGDQPSFVEYHWHGLWLLTGNAYVLAGLALFLALCGLALSVRRRKPGGDAPLSGPNAHLTGIRGS
jgi:alpha-1,2-mannosyltransferase